MLFYLQVFFFRSLMTLQRWAARIIRFPEPHLFTGDDASGALCDAIAGSGARHVLIVTDAMLVKLGLVAPMIDRLRAGGVASTCYDGVLPDPAIDQVEAGLAQLKAAGCDAVLAVGGGSSIDAAKVIAARATNHKPVRRMVGLFRVFRRPLPLYAVPTTAGTGSEVTIGAVISDPEAQRKCVVMDPKLVPLMAALDGGLMTGLPAAVTAATGMDALTHAIEAYLSRNATAETDRDALSAVATVFIHLPRVMHDGALLESRQALAVASYRAGRAITNAGVGFVHAIAHNFGARYHLPHGRANAMVLPFWLETIRDDCEPRLAALARAADLGVAGDSEASLATALIAAIRDLNQRLEIPAQVNALKAADIPAIARAAREEAHWTYAVPRYLRQADCEQLLVRMLPAAA